MEKQQEHINKYITKYYQKKNKVEYYILNIINNIYVLLLRENTQIKVLLNKNHKLKWYRKVLVIHNYLNHKKKENKNIKSFN